MNSAKRINTPGSRASAVVTRQYGALRTLYRLSLKTGTVRHVDPIHLTMTVEWEHGASGMSPIVPISFPICGPSSFLGMLPEEGAVGIFGFYMEGDTEKTAPFVLAYLPANLTDALQYNKMQLHPNSIPNEDKNVFQYRFKPLASGDINICSPNGGNFFATTDVEISDKMRDRIQIRNSDQSIIQTSISNFMFADGVSINAGRIIRPHFCIFGNNFERITGTNVRETTLSDTRTTNFLVPFGERITSNSQFYSEYRVDVADVIEGILDENGINFPGTTSLKGTADSIMSLIMGNYVGNNIADKNYARILRPSLFNEQGQGQFSLVECTQFNGFDQVKSLGMAFALHSIKTGFFMGVDKEGHYFLNLPASTSHPLGGGRSMSMLATGSLQEQWGSDSKENNSWNLSTKGGVKWIIKAHNEKKFNRSIDIKSSSSIFIEAGANDTEPVGVDIDGKEGTLNFARQDRSYGNALTMVGGIQYFQIGGDQRSSIAGLKSEQVFGSVSLQYQVDKSENVLGVSTEIVGAEKQGKYAKRTVTVNGNDKLDVWKGDRTEDIHTFGNRKTTVLGVGNIEEMVFTGDKTVTVVTGNYKVSVATGQIDISTALGSAKISATTGITVDAGLVGAVNVKGSKVTLGNSLMVGGVVTGGKPGFTTHYDYCTGAPLMASFTVEASA